MGRQEVKLRCHSFEALQQCLINQRLTESTFLAALPFTRITRIGDQSWLFYIDSGLHASTESPLPTNPLISSLLQACKSSFYFNILKYRKLFLTTLVYSSYNIHYLTLLKMHYNPIHCLTHRFKYNLHFLSKDFVVSHLGPKLILARKCVTVGFLEYYLLVDVNQPSGMGEIISAYLDMAP